MPAQHAVLSASSSKQWIHCPPSARLQEDFPNESSVFAEEGTWAHELCEYKVKKYLHERKKRPQSEFLTEEIDQSTDVYAGFVISIIEGMKQNGCEPLCFVEERLDFSNIVPGGFGTGDMVIIGRDEQGRGLIHIVDYKNGKGVFVDAYENSQMMLYATGALNAYGYIYEIEVVRMSIVQPRLENISTYEMSSSELRSWGESIKPIAETAFEGKGEQHPGDWCRFCRAKPVCRACMEEALALVKEEFLDLDEGVLPESTDGAGETDATASYDPDGSVPVFKPPGLVSFGELEAILPTLNRISSWIESVFAFVSGEAINHGVAVEGYKVVEGRSKRVFTDTNAVIKAAEEQGYTDIYRQELLTLTEFEKMMGKKKFAQILGEYVTKPPGKLALVPVSDPRPAVDVSSAGVEFDVLE